MQIHTSAHTKYTQKWKEASRRHSFLWHSLAGPHPSCSVMPDGGWAGPRRPCPAVPTRCQCGRGSPRLYLPQWRDCHLNNRPSHCLSCQRNPHTRTSHGPLMTCMLRPIVTPAPNGGNPDYYQKKRAIKVILGLGVVTSSGKVILRLFNTFEPVC